MLRLRYRSARTCNVRHCGSAVWFGRTRAFCLPSPLKRLWPSARFKTADLAGPRDWLFLPTACPPACYTCHAHLVPHPPPQHANMVDAIGFCGWTSSLLDKRLRRDVGGCYLCTFVHAVAPDYTLPLCPTPHPALPTHHPSRPTLYIAPHTHTPPPRLPTPPFPFPHPPLVRFCSTHPTLHCMAYLPHTTLVDLFPHLVDLLALFFALFWFLYYLVDTFYLPTTATPHTHTTSGDCFLPGCTGPARLLPFPACPPALPHPTLGQFSVWWLPLILPSLFPYLLVGLPRLNTTTYLPYYYTLLHTLTIRGREQMATFRLLTGRGCRRWRAGRTGDGEPSDP